MYKLAVVLLALAVGQTCFGESNDSSSEPDIFDVILADRVPLVLGDEMPDIGTSSDSTDRIVGGKETTIEDHPYQVSFVVDNKYFCGGFIVSEDYILTAAHCAQSVDPDTVVLRAGSSFRSNGTVIKIAEVHAHPMYNNPQYDKDVAVFKTAEKIQFSDTIKPIGLPKQGRRMVGGSKVVISGWGRTKYGASTIPEQLMAVEVPVVNHLQCRLVYPTILSDNEFCAGNFFLGGQGTCQGDSGGAATQNDMAVGIVSFGRGCGQPLSPSVFADIASKPIREFIKEKTNL